MTGASENPYPIMTTRRPRTAHAATMPGPGPASWVRHPRAAIRRSWRRVRPAILAPITALITILGAYTLSNSTFDIFVMIAFGVIGYLMKKTGFEPGPMVLYFVLGSLIESSFRRSMLIFEGDATGFGYRIAVVATAMALVLLPFYETAPL